MKRTALVSALLAGATFPLGAQSPQSFRPVNSIGVDGVAEIIDATADGNTLIYTNSSAEEIGFINIRDPRRARHLSSVKVAGEPTSVSVVGKYAFATVWTDKHSEGEPVPQFNPGKLYIIDVATRRVLGTVDVGWHPDSVKATVIGRQIVAVIAIENEPVIVDSKGLVEDNDVPGHPNDKGPAGVIQVVTLNPGNIENSAVKTLSVPPAMMTRAGLLFPNDPQPEFVDIHGSTAAVSLQENNGIAIVDIRNPSRPALTRVFGLGAVSNRRADLTEDDDILFNEVYPRDIDGVKHDLPTDGAGNKVKPGLRFPDSIAFSPDGRTIFSADEGEMNFTGGRGFSVWSTTGRRYYEDRGQLEGLALSLSHYPEGRSENKGIEIEGIATARFGSRDIAIVMSERGSFMALFDIGDPARPRLMQVLPTGVSPEGVVAIEKRGLICTAEEESGTISVFQASSKRYVPSRNQPTLYSTKPWAAISGLTSFGFGNWLAGVPDNAMPTEIYLVGVGGPYARVMPAFKVKKDGKQMRYDGEGIVRDSSVLGNRFFGGFFLASEGDAKDNPNLLVQTSLFGTVQREIQLPNSIDAAADATLPGKAQGPKGGMKIRSNGFEGVAISEDRNYAVAAIQRDFADEFPTGARYARIARYDLRQLNSASKRAKLCKNKRCGGDWSMFYYKLDSNDGSNWAGLSEILAIGDDQYLVVERDKGLGNGSKLKKLYAFSLKGLKPDTDGKPDATDTVKKVLSMNILGDFFPFEKVEGLALQRGDLWVGLDNDGGEVESRLINKGRFRNPLR